MIITEKTALRMLKEQEKISQIWCHVSVDVGLEQTFHTIYSGSYPTTKVTNLLSPQASTVSAVNENPISKYVIYYKFMYMYVLSIFIVIFSLCKPSSH